MTTPIPREPATIALICRWMMKAIELVRRMYVAGYDPDAELEKLHRRYDLRRDTGRIWLGDAADDEKS